MVNVWEALDTALDSASDRPRIASDAEFARFSSRLQGEHAVIHNPRARTYFRLTAAEADLAESLDGSRTVAELTVAGLGSGSGLDPDQVVGHIGFLRRAGLLTRTWVDVYGLIRARLTPLPTRILDRVWRRMRAPTLTIRGVNRVVDVLYRAGARHVFNPFVQVALLLLFAGGLTAFLVAARAGRFTLLGEPTAGAAAALLLLGLVALLVHELGHALAVRHAGRRILGAGFQLYLANPAFFIDSSDMVMASRRARAVNAIAGPYAEAVLASASALVAAAIPDLSVAPLLWRFSALTFLLVLVNLIPFIELDGYWLMTDLLDLPDLRPRSLAFLRHDLLDSIRSRRGLTRYEWGLTLFGVVGALATVGALAVAWTLWWPIMRAFGSGLWRAGLPGQVLLVLLGLLVLAPVAHGLGDVVRGARRRLLHAWQAIRFRGQRGWRVEAAEGIAAALPGADTLAAEDLGDLAGRVGRRRFARGEALVRQGETAKAFYVIRRGRCAVVVKDVNGGESQMRHLGPGATFGELALLEGTPRSATVRAETSGEVFVVDASTFQRILAGIAGNLPVPRDWPVARVWALRPFRTLGLATAGRLAVSGGWVSASAGDVVIREGDVGDRFYVVESGQLEVREQDVRVATMRPGDFFGEIALLRDVPRTATVQAMTPTRLFALDRSSFDRLLRASLQTGHLAPPPRAATHSAYEVR